MVLFKTIAATVSKYPAAMGLSHCRTLSQKAFHNSNYCLPTTEFKQFGTIWFLTIAFNCTNSMDKLLTVIQFKEVQPQKATRQYWD